MLEKKFITTVALVVSAIVFLTIVVIGKTSAEPTPDLLVAEYIPTDDIPIAIRDVFLEGSPYEGVSSESQIERIAREESEPYLSEWRRFREDPQHSQEAKEALRAYREAQILKIVALRTRDSWGNEWEQEDPSMLSDEEIKEELQGVASGPLTSEGTLESLKSSFSEAKDVNRNLIRETAEVIQGYDFPELREIKSNNPQVVQQIAETSPSIEVEVSPSTQISELDTRTQILLHEKHLEGRFRRVRMFENAANDQEQRLLLVEELQKRQHAQRILSDIEPMLEVIEPWAERNGYSDLVAGVRDLDSQAMIDLFKAMSYNPMEPNQTAKRLRDDVGADLIRELSRNLVVTAATSVEPSAEALANYSFYLYGAQQTDSEYMAKAYDYAVRAENAGHDMNDGLMQQMGEWSGELEASYYLKLRCGPGLPLVHCYSGETNPHFLGQVGGLMTHGKPHQYGTPGRDFREGPVTRDFSLTITNHPRSRYMLTAVVRNSAGNFYKQVSARPGEQLSVQGEGFNM